MLAKMPALGALNAKVADTSDLPRRAALAIIGRSIDEPSIADDSIVDAMVNAQTAGRKAILAKQEAADNAGISAFGSLLSEMNPLAASLASLANGELQSRFTAKVTGKGIHATAGTGAIAGKYEIGVSQIATGQVLSSAGFDATRTLGTGELTLMRGDRSVTVGIDNSNNTIAGIAAAINVKAGDQGITATVINGTDGAHLVLGSLRTGAVNTINVKIDKLSTDNGLSSFAVSSEVGIDGGASTIASANSSRPWTQSTPAQDARLTMDGIPSRSASNAVSNVLAGVTLNLTRDATSRVGARTLTIEADTAFQESAIVDFVSRYNGLTAKTSELTKYTEGAGSQGPLIGDPVVGAIRNALSSIVSRSVPSATIGGHVSLLAIGIELQKDGTLSVDSKKLKDALANNAPTVAMLFDRKNGIGARMLEQIGSFTKENGLVNTRISALNGDLKHLSQQESVLANYASQLRKQYQVQFTALDTLMARLNKNTQYLTRLFGGEHSSGTLGRG